MLLEFVLLARLNRGEIRENLLIERDGKISLIQSKNAYRMFL